LQTPARVVIFTIQDAQSVYKPLLAAGLRLLVHLVALRQHNRKAFLRRNSSYTRVLATRRRERINTTKSIIVKTIIMEKLTKSFLLKTKEILSSLLLILCINTGFAQTDLNVSGWYLTDYSFKDGSLEKESVLMGTTSKLKDVISFKGDKGNIEIMQNRYAVPDGQLIAGVTYQVIWTSPPAVLLPGENYSIDFQLITKASKTWKAPQQSMHFNQSPYSVYFVTPDGTKYFTKDIKSVLTTDKVINKGTKGAKRFIQMNFGNGFVGTYNYEWRDL